MHVVFFVCVCLFFETKLLVVTNQKLHLSAEHIEIRMLGIRSLGVPSQNQIHSQT